MQMDTDAMKASGLHHDDVLVIDKALIPVSGCIVVAAFNGEFLVRRYQPTARGYLLLSDDEMAGSSVRVNELIECEIWGVVTHAIHTVRP